MNILIFLLAVKILPTTSYEMGHYAPIFMAGELGYNGCDFVCDMFWEDMCPVKKKWISFWVGMGTQVIFRELLKSHYKTENEKAWGACGGGQQALIRMSITIFYALKHDKPFPTLLDKNKRKKWIARMAE